MTLIPRSGESTRASRSGCISDSNGRQLPRHLISRGSTRAHSARARPPVWRRRTCDLDGDFHGMPTRSTPAIQRAATTGSAKPVVHRRMSTDFLLPLLVRSTIATKTASNTFCCCAQHRWTTDLVVHVRGVAQRRFLGRCRGDDCLRSGDRCRTSRCLSRFGPVAAREDGHGQCAGGQAIGEWRRRFCASRCPRVSADSRITRRRLRLLWSDHQSEAGLGGGLVIRMNHAVLYVRDAQRHRRFTKTSWASGQSSTVPARSYS